MRKYAAELVGTFVLVFAGVGSAVLAGKHIGFAGIALAFGLSLLVMVYTIGPISGCHINPAVTFGVLLARRIGIKDAIGYWIAQIIGGILAAGVLLFVARGIAGGYSASVSGLGADGFGLHSPDHYTMAAGFVVEVVLTAFLVIVVLGATDVKAPVGFAGIAIGLVLTMDHLGGDSGYEYVGESSAEHRPGGVCWRVGIESSMAVHSCATHWRSNRSGDLCAHPHPRREDFASGRRTRTAEPAGGAGVREWAAHQ